MTTTTKKPSLKDRIHAALKRKRKPVTMTDIYKMFPDVPKTQIRGRVYENLVGDFEYNKRTKNLFLRHDGSLYSAVTGAESFVKVKKTRQAGKVTKSSKSTPGRKAAKKAPKKVAKKGTDKKAPEKKKPRTIKDLKADRAARKKKQEEVKKKAPQYCPTLMQSFEAACDDSQLLMDL